MALRQAIHRLVVDINPLDESESASQMDVLRWIDSGAPLFRVQKPNVPPKHLISYFLVVDGGYLLLVDHISAGLWLPSGGHVEPEEHPTDTVRREVVEELKIEADFLTPGPFFISQNETVGRTAGHTDVCLWYLLKHPREIPLDFDRSEFHSIRWFPIDQLPLDRCDPNLGRVALKLKQRFPL